MLWLNKAKVYYWQILHPSPLWCSKHRGLGAWSSASVNIWHKQTHSAVGVGFEVVSTGENSCDCHELFRYQKLWSLVKDFTIEKGKEGDFPWSPSKLSVTSILEQTSYENRRRNWNYEQWAQSVPVLSLLPSPASLVATELLEVSTRFHWAQVHSTEHVFQSSFKSTVYTVQTWFTWTQIPRLVRGLYLLSVHTSVSHTEQKGKTKLPHIHGHSCAEMYGTNTWLGDALLTTCGRINTKGKQWAEDKHRVSSSSWINWRWLQTVPAFEEMLHFLINYLEADHCKQSYTV